MVLCIRTKQLNRNSNLFKLFKKLKGTLGQKFFTAWVDLWNSFYV